MKEFRRRYSDRAAKVPRQRISRLAFLLAGLLIAVTSASLVFIGFVASHASTQQAYSNEMRLFRSTLADRMRAVVHEQISITSSDQSVAKLVRTFEPDYARQSFSSLWSDYGHSKIILISGDGEILAESFEEEVHFLKRPVREIPAAGVVYDKLKRLYKRNRVQVPGGFGHRSLQTVDPSDYAIMGFIRIDGKPALFGAMPIVPDKYKTPLPDGPPTVLLSALFIDNLMLKRLNSQLNFSSLRFLDGVAQSPGAPFHLVSGQNGGALGTFKWDGQSVGDSIWPTIIPVIVVLSIALAALAAGIAWKIGQLTSSLQASEQQNRYLALHDTLTGLANRLQFNRALETAVNALPERPFALFHCDLDKFKIVNDTFGHGAGDTVLREMASRLKNVVGNSGLVCRIGGDEFMVLYHGSAETPKLLALCRALVDSGRIPVQLQGDDLAQAGLSVGVALAPENGETAEEIVTCADAALYEAKHAGRNRYAFYEDTEGTKPGSPLSLSGSNAPVPLPRAGKAV